MLIAEGFLALLQLPACSVSHLGPLDCMRDQWAAAANHMRRGMGDREGETHNR